MLEMLLQWYRRHFSDPQATALIMILLVGFGTLYFFGAALTPLLVAVALAYLLEWLVASLQRLHIARWLATSIVVLLLVTLMLLTILVLIPVIWQQCHHLVRDLPAILSSFHDFILTLPYYPTLVDAGISDAIANNLHAKLMSLGTSIVRSSMTSLITLGKLIVYLVLMPLIVFFLLKDKHYFINTLRPMLPHNRLLAGKVWREMNQQITHYIHGKMLEILIVTLVTYGLLAFFQLRYALLLAVLVGFSVLIPYIGALLATLPLAIIALFQWGMGPHFWYCMTLYTLLQILDANLLVPLLFSETLNLHPLVIILSTLLFGSLWGFWGLFFAIPLATLVKAILNAWPPSEQRDLL